MKKCVLNVDDRLFCREAVLKTAYLFLDDYYIHLFYKTEHEIGIEVEAKSGVDMTGVDKRLGNELIAQMVRYQLANSNKGIKDLILGRALYSTCIDTEAVPTQEFAEEGVEIFSLDDIAVDWFEKNEASG